MTIEKMDKKRKLLHQNFTDEGLVKKTKISHVKELRTPHVDVGGHRCKTDGCSTLAQKNGMCYKHGGVRRCKTDECNRLVKKNGMCYIHLT